MEFRSFLPTAYFINALDDFSSYPFLSIPGDNGFPRFICGDASVFFGISKPMSEAGLFDPF
jgi:hypothetical protein